MVQRQNRILLSKSRLSLGLIFFLFCYIYLWIVVKPDLIYHGFGTLITDIPVFVTGWDFLIDSLRIPGGFTLYAYGLLSQEYYHSWLGALLIVLMALCLYELSRRHLAHIGHFDSSLLPFFPAVMIVLLYNHYEHPLAVCLVVSVGLLLSLGFEKIPIRSLPIRIVIYCLMAAISYWLAGAGGVFIFSLMTTIYLLFIRKEWIPAVLAFPAVVVIIWFLAEYVFHLSLKQAFLLLIPSLGVAIDVKGFMKVLIVMLYAFVPATVLLIFLWRTLFGKHANASRLRKQKDRKKHAVSSHWQWDSLTGFLRLVVPVVPLVVLAAGLYLSTDRIHRQIVIMNSLSRQERWPEVLELGYRLPKNIFNIYCNHDINRALYYVGRLGYDMFCFPQNPHALLLTQDQEESSMTQLKMCDAYIELGNVNFAEKMASEFLATEGRIGLVLEKLAWINIIKGQEDTARIYLNALRKDLICRDKAESILGKLDNGFDPNEDAHIHRIGSFIRREDNPRLYKESVVEMLTGLLRQNPGNRMAFEYLMAFYLLAGELEKIMENIGRLADLGYREIPTLYEEAMLIYQGIHGRKPDLGKFNIKPETIERYNRFVRRCNSIQTQDPQAVLQYLVPEFGTSYFFYYRFTVSRLTGTQKH